MTNLDMDIPDEVHDILIIGAGISGINAAHRVREQLPHRKLTILEARSVIGGTWSFWKYPGLRSDSSLRAFGFSWHPWKHAHLIGSGPEIVEYVTEAAQADGTFDKILFRHRVEGAEWSSERQTWRLEVDADGHKKIYDANFIIGCTGYYSYEKALDSPIPGIENFAGKVVHPQWWPEDLDYNNQRVTIIGSGATAYTLLPEMAGKSKSITMLQRSPSYVVSIPRTSSLEWFLSLILPLSWVHGITRCLDISHEVIMTEFFLAAPRFGKWLLTWQTKQEVPKHVDVSVHFNPRYGPIQQRLCMTPDGEFFKALERDNCEIVTDIIETVTEDGILLKSGRKLETDIIITATGMHLQLFDGLAPKVDGKPLNFGKQYSWRGCLIEGLPNFSFLIGYVTTSWTPGVDSMINMIIRVIKQMELEGAASVIPVIEREKIIPHRSPVRANSNYLVKALDRLPLATGKAPFYGRQSLLVDTWALFFGSVKDGLLYGGHGSKKMN
ncbi:FAD-containing monooxygenase EthA [Cladobotryum mycophilum]|uniref:FAD-containing monooxygenase EthA n=1 Tax=Cladobotryum mycophilum TaxID=491253 RepID=A0ABR0SKG6_9HYPO